MNTTKMNGYDVKAKDPKAAYDAGNGTMVRPTSILEDSLDELTSRRDGLNVTINRLIDRLEPLLAPVPPSEDSQNPARQIRGQVVSRISCEVDMLAILDYRLACMIDRLEI